MVFEEYVRIGVTFPKKDVKLPKNWPNLKSSVYNGEKNFAVLTGKVNNVIVVDLDRKDEDFVALKWFEDIFGDINKMDSLVTKTINGGYHIFFRYNSKLKKTNNKEYHIDILSDKCCCYQGDGYDVVVKKEPRELSNEEVKQLLMLGKKEAKKEVVVYKERNKLMNLPMNTIWEETKTDTGIQYTPLCTNCLVNPCKEHSDEKHSCLFINNDKSIVKSCYSCDSVIVADKKESKKIMTLFLNVKSNEETVYEELTYDILEIARENNYKREEGTGIVYEKVRSYAYKPYMEPLKFLNKIFLKSRKFKSNVNNMDNLIKYMKQYDEEDFPFMVRDPHYLGFRNGVLNTITCEFSEEPEDDDILVRKYFDYNFNYSTETPLMDKILDYQFTPDVRDFVYACLGRMFEIRDNYGFMLYLLGEAGCGKSLVIDVLCACFNKIGCINESYEIKYGIASLYDKDIIVCDDLPKNISQVFPQQTFQSCVTGGLVASAVKNKDAMEVQWKVPMLWAGNWFPDYLDKGQISRRLLTANFEKIVNNPDPSLKKRIIETELPALMYKCLLFYKKMIEHGYVEVWKFCPEYFVEQKEELRLERNPFFKFLLENSEYKEGNVVSMDKLRDNFSNWLGKKVHKLDNGTIKQVNSDFEIIQKKVCKHCLKEHKKGCCEMYKSIDRTTKYFIMNMELI